MTTETTTDYQIEERLEQIAPHPEENMTAASLARYLAVRAQLGFTRNVTPFIRDGQEVPASLILPWFAAAHALIALGETDPVFADEVARRITDAWQDGNCLGAYLHQDLTYLEVDPAEVSRLDAARLALEKTEAAK